jgi:teichuronic acid biosynthesis glycosyltransferase TuaC
MRVAVVAEYYPRAADPVLGVWAHRQALAARDAGAEVHVLVLDRPIPPMTALRDPRRLGRELATAVRRPRRATLDGVDVEYVRFVSPPRGRSYASWHRWARRSLARALDRARPFDLLHAHYAHLAGAAALPWTRSHEIPLCVSVHGGDVLVPELTEVSAHTLREASAVLCNSAATLRRSARLAGGEEHMRVVHLGTDVPAAAELPPKHEEPTVATLAHVIPRKRHEDVLSALPDGVRWVVIGDGPELSRLEALAGGRATFLGRLPPERALYELARCHVMAMPSVDEAFGVAYVESLARGVPVIGVEGEGGPEEIAALGGGVLLVPPRDPAALRRAIERALADEDLPRQARTTASEHFTWEACGRATVAAYEDLL